MDCKSKYRKTMLAAIGIAIAGKPEPCTQALHSELGARRMLRITMCTYIMLTSYQG